MTGADGQQSHRGTVRSGARRWQPRKMPRAPTAATPPDGAHPVWCRPDFCRNRSNPCNDRCARCSLDRLSRPSCARPSTTASASASRMFGSSRLPGVERNVASPKWRASSAAPRSIDGSRRPSAGLRRHRPGRMYFVDEHRCADPPLPARVARLGRFDRQTRSELLKKGQHRYFVEHMAHSCLFRARQIKKQLQNSNDQRLAAFHPARHEQLDPSGIRPDRTPVMSRLRSKADNHRSW